MSESEGRHVHEYAHLHIDTDGYVAEADTVEEMLARLREALRDEDIDVDMEWQGYERIYDSDEDDN